MPDETAPTEEIKLKPSAEEFARLKANLAALKLLNEASKAVESPKEYDPFEDPDMGATPHLDALVVGKPAISEERMSQLEQDVDDAETNWDTFVQVSAVILKVVIAAAKAAA